MTTRSEWQPSPAQRGRPRCRRHPLWRAFSRRSRHARARRAPAHWAGCREWGSRRTYPTAPEHRRDRPWGYRTEPRAPGGENGVLAYK